MPGSKLDDQVAMNCRTRASGDDQTAIRRACECCDSALDFVSLTHVNRPQLHSERRRRGLDCSKLPDPGGCGGIPENRHSRQAWRDLLEQFQPFPAEAVFKRDKTGGVAAGPRQAVDEAGADRIEESREYNRNDAGCL